MSKVHFPRNAEQYDRLTAEGNAPALLALRAACGTRPTARAIVDLSTDPEVVDCQKCRAHLPTATETIEERMRAAHAAGDFAEVVRLALGRD